MPRVDDRCIALSDVHAVGPAALDEIRAVIQDEERAMLVAGPPERRRRGDDLIVRELLVAQLDDVDPAAKGGVEKL